MNKKVTYIVLALTVLFVLNLIGKKLYKRFDLTLDKRYTLSNITKTLSNKIDQKLFINIYLEGDFPSEFKRLQIETQQFLEELKTENANIIFRFINPDNIREQLVKKGMYPSQLTVEEDGKLSTAIIFPWAEVIYKKKIAIVSLLPEVQVKTQEQQLLNAVESLEYSFANAIDRITKEKKLKIAVLSGNGQLPDIELYSFLSEVSKKYHLAKFTLDSVEKTPHKTLKDLSDFDLAIIAKPTKKFTSKEKFTLDQFIINGGKTLWMLDNVQADTDSLYNNGKMLAYPRDLDLTDMLFQYGVRVNNTLIQDLYAAKIPLATGNVGNQAQFQNLDWFYNPLVGGNPNHPITKNILPVRLRFATQIDTLNNNIKKTPLLVSSLLTKKIGLPTIVKLSSIANQPTEQEFSSGNQLFGVLLEGNFTSAYATRIKPFTTELFKEKSLPNKMIIIADGDIGKNQILQGKPHDLATDKWTNQRFGNKDFLLNSIDYLVDHSGLIQLKNKSLRLNILDKQQAQEEKRFWQFINIVLPILLLFLFGFVFTFWRKRKYTI